MASQVQRGWTERIPTSNYLPRDSAVFIPSKRIHEKHGHDLKFKQVAEGFISKGFLDPSDGKS